MPKNIIGLILISFGCGILAANFIPWWGIIAAIGMIAAGIIIIVKKC